MDWILRPGTEGSRFKTKVARFKGLGAMSPDEFGTERRVLIRCRSYAKPVGPERQADFTKP